jgi:hypothetical protein
MHSATSKEEREAVATVVAALLIVAAPPAALAAVQHQQAFRPRRPRRAAWHWSRTQDASGTAECGLRIRDLGP